MTPPKPLNWIASPGIGYAVIRRPDGGMTLTFTKSRRKAPRFSGGDTPHLRWVQV